MKPTAYIRQAALSLSTDTALDRSRLAKAIKNLRNNVESLASVINLNGSPQSLTSAQPQPPGSTTTTAHGHPRLAEQAATKPK